MHLSASSFFHFSNGFIVQNQCSVHSAGLRWACVRVRVRPGGISSLVIVVRASFGMALAVSGEGKLCVLNTMATAQ